MLVRFYILVISCKIVSKHIFSQFCNLLKFSSKNLKLCPIKREESKHLQASLCQRKQLDGCWDYTFGEIRKIRQENSSQDYSTTGDVVTKFETVEGPKTREKMTVCNLYNTPYTISLIQNVVFEKLNTRTSSSDRAALSKGAAIINRLSCMSSMRFVFKS